ncbi:MAG: ABC transporter substrate-binding protein [Acidobacteriota bacterium]
MKRALLPLALIALCACPASPPPAPGGGDHAAPPATPGASPSPVAGGYDPKKDPLVNPASLREPLPLDPGDVAEDETLYRTLEGNPANLNPIFISSTFEFYFADLLFTGLFEFDGKMQWRVNEDVVEHFEEAPDHLSYTVKMKPGLTWQDGQPFNAEDVRFSWQQILDDKVPCPAVRSGTDEIVDVQVLDPLTLKMVHKAALATNRGARVPHHPEAPLRRTRRRTRPQDGRLLREAQPGDRQQRYGFVEWLAAQQDRRGALGRVQGEAWTLQAHGLPHHPDNSVQL